jgi:ParB family chromosome partitioning protein
LLPSEKAFALKHHLEALKKLNGGQGRRNDIVELIQSQESGGDSSRNADLPDNNAKNVTSSQLATKSRTDKQVAANYGLSKDTMHRFIRLTNLTQEFLDKVDENKLALISAVNISYLSMEEQNLLNRILHDTGEKLDIKKSEALKTAHNKQRKGELTEHDINKILKGEKKEAKTKNDIVKALKKTYAKYFDEDAPQEKIVYTIDRALEFFHAAIERGDIDEEDETAYEFSDFDNFNSENENEDEAVSFSDEFKPNDEKENTDNDEDSYKDEFYPDF